ncbi:MAG: hypothetical protein KZQ93_01605 [Candidatus Thiodiazotropha sp. (ex Monitilora ramsayi)]|nr:hypothetical protein [Candidatus Thiodiazotropha sp. (ex Monitilora ramsayi)]
MFRRTYWLVIAAILFTCESLPAHGLKLFVVVEGDVIEGRVNFAGGHSAASAVIKISDSEGRPLAEKVPDEKGEFSYKVSRRMDHLIVADSREGHVARWRVKAEDIVLASPEPVEKPVPIVGERVERSIPDAALHDHAAEYDEWIVGTIEQVVARQVRPLREQLAAYEERVRLRDIVGGLGYIIGLTGLALWWRCRKQAKA